MLLTMTLDIQTKLCSSCAYAHGSRNLKAMFSPQNRADRNLLQTREKNFTLAQEEGQNQLATHVQKMRLPWTLGAGLASVRILICTGMGRTVNENYMPAYRLHEDRLPKKDANLVPLVWHTSREAVFRKTKKLLPPPKKDNPAKDAICHQCGEVGHWRRNCPVYLAELMKKKKLSQGASASGNMRMYKAKYQEL
ncbi:zinc finger, CCHC-type containing protein [Tanacetum coccineum]